MGVSPHRAAGNAAGRSSHARPPPGPLAPRRLDTPTAIHVSVLLLQAAVWYSTKRRLWRTATLPWVDAGLTLCTLTAQAFQLTHLKLGGAHHLDQMIVLTSYCVLTCRAVTVPSKPHLTFVVSALGE